MVQSQPAWQAAQAVEARALDELRLVGAFGTNKVMAGELSRLVRRGAPDVRLPDARKLGVGAVGFPFDARVARLAALYHRTSARVLWDVLLSPAERLEPLYADVVRLARERVALWLWKGAGISVYAHAVQDFAAGERQIVGTVKNALIEAAGQAGLNVQLEVEAPDVVFSVRGDEAGGLRVSIDLAGRPMHQRGYRRERGLAPLREDLAAVLLMLARYDPRRDLLIDPMAGSGTIAIEAACMAKALPVFVPARRPALERIPAFHELAGAGDPPLFADSEPQIIASDIDPQCAPVIRAAAETAGVSASLRVLTSDFRDLSPRLRSLSGPDMFEQGLILSNPPYGERMAPRELEASYADLGRFCSKFQGFRAAFLVANPSFEAAFGPRPRIKKPLSNGPLRGYFYLYEL